MKRNIKLLALFNFFCDFHLYSAILIIYFAKITGSYALGMSLFSVTMVSSALFEIPTGVFSDYLGRKKTIILGAICSILAIVFYAIGSSYMVLFIGALFEGLRRAWYSGNNDALLYESLSNEGKKEEYDHYLGKTSSMFQIASAIGIIAGGFVASWSFHILMWISVIPQIICLLIAFKITEPEKHSRLSSNIYSHIKLSVSKIWSNKKLRLLSISRIYGYAISESAYQFRGAFINTLWPLWAVGFSKVLSSIGAGISYWHSGRIIKRYGAYRLLFFSNVFSKVIDIFSVGFATVFSPLIMASTSIYFGVTEVANSKLMQKEFTDDQRATLGSVNSFFGNLAFGAVAILIGLFADIIGPAKTLLVAYVCSLPTTYIRWILYKGNKNE